MADYANFQVSPHASRPIHAQHVLALYRAEGWWPERTSEEIAKVLDTHPAAGAWHDDRLVGFVRAVSDGVMRAYIEDVLVAPDARGNGVGRALIAAILDQLRPIPVTTLFCGARLADYYERAGFRRTQQVVLHRQASEPGF